MTTLIIIIFGLISYTCGLYAGRAIWGESITHREQEILDRYKNEKLPN